MASSPMWKSKSSIPLREAMLDVRGGIAVPRTEAEPAAASRVAIAVGNTLIINEALLYQKADEGSRAYKEGSEFPAKLSCNSHGS